MNQKKNTVNILQDDTISIRILIRPMPKVIIIMYQNTYVNYYITLGQYL